MPLTNGSNPITIKDLDDLDEHITAVVRKTQQELMRELHGAMLEVLATSRSDTRGLLGMADVSGEPVGAGPREVQLVVRISALGVSAERLRTLVEDCNHCSPIYAAVRDAVPVALQIEVDAA